VFEVIQAMNGYRTVSAAERRENVDTAKGRVAQLQLEMLCERPLRSRLLLTSTHKLVRPEQKHEGTFCMAVEVV